MKLRTFYRPMVVTALSCSVVFAAGANTKGKKNPAQPLTSLQQFLTRVQGQPVPTTAALGSLWPLQGSLLTDLATDYKARRLNDLVVISIVEQTLAQAEHDVTAQRAFTSGSGITAIAGQVNTASFNPLYGLTSSSNPKATPDHSSSTVRALCKPSGPNVTRSRALTSTRGALVVTRERESSGIWLPRPDRFA